MKEKTYSDIAIKWLATKKRTVKESTYYTYETIIKNWISPFFKDVEISKINKIKIKLFLKKLNMSKLSSLYVRDITTVLKMLFKGTNKAKLFECPEIIHYPLKGTDNTNVEEISILEKNKLTDYLFQNKTNINVGILLAIWTGLRIGEICALKYTDIDFCNCKLRVASTLQRIKNNDGKTKTKIVITKPKSVKSIRTIPVSKILTEYINDICKERYNRNYFLISGNKYPIEPRSLRRYFTNILQHLNMKHYKFHSLRHNFAYECINNKVDYKTVSSILGHSSVATTLDFYVYSKDKDKQDCIDKIFDSYLETTNLNFDIKDMGVIK